MKQTLLFLLFSLCFFCHAELITATPVKAEIRTGEPLAFEIRWEQRDGYHLNGWQLYAYAPAVPEGIAKGEKVYTRKAVRPQDVIYVFGGVENVVWLPASQRNLEKMTVSVPTGNWPSGNYQLGMSLVIVSPEKEQKVVRIPVKVKIISQKEENIALNKPYTLSPAPNYDLCTGTSDTKDLTDGKIAKPRQWLWTDQGTVGWKYVRKPISITIDLRKIYPVNRVRFSTGAGCSGVKFPNQLDYEASIDGEKFYRIGDLTQDDPVASAWQNISENSLPADAQTGYRTHIYDVTYPAVNARYVRIHLIPEHVLFFVDEVEVFADPGVAVSKLEDYPLVDGDEGFIKNQSKLTIRKSMHRILAAATDGKGDPALEKQIREWELNGDPEALDAVYPFDPLQIQLFARNAEAWKTRGVKDFAFWTDDFYAPLSPEKLSSAFESDPQKVVLKETVFAGEKRPLILNIAYTGKENASISINRFVGDFYRVAYLDSKKGDPTSTLLFPLRKGEQIIPGMVTQLVLIPETKDLLPGISRFQVEVFLNGVSRRFPVELTVLPEKYPARPKLECGGWDYLDGIANGEKQNWLGWPAEYAPDANKKFQDAGIVSTYASGSLGKASRLQNLKLNPDGSLAEAIDFTAFDKWTTFRPDAQRYLIYCALDYVEKLDSNILPGTPQFERAVKEWAKAWNDHIVKRKLQGRVAMQLLDEPWSEHEFTQESLWLKPFTEGAPDIPVLSNPTLNFRKEWGKHLAYTKILCPELNLLHGENGDNNLREFQRIVKENKGRFWLYSCDYGTFSSPPSVLRNPGWTAFRSGATGYLRWGLTQGVTKLTRNQYARAWSTIYYSPLYFDANGVGITKHYCAIRDAVQDYELLTRLSAEIDRQEKAGKNMNSAKKLLADSLENIAKEEFRNYQLDKYYRASEVRKKLLLLFVELTRK